MVLNTNLYGFEHKPLEQRGAGAGAVNSKSLRFPTQATEKAASLLSQHFYHSRFAWQ
jgi:hypothetical protein